jgi:hypothetical protein
MRDPTLLGRPERADRGQVLAELERASGETRAKTTSRAMRKMDMLEPLMRTATGPLIGSAKEARSRAGAGRADVRLRQSLQPQHGPSEAL